MPKKIGNHHDEFIKRFFREGESKVIGRMNEFQARKQDGTLFPIELSVGVTGSGEKTLFTGIAHDITHRKQAETQTRQALKDKFMAESANEAKSSFLANMSHEIRTPLTTIIGFSETLLQSNQSMQERYKAIQTIISSGNHLSGLINSILDLSKIESGKLDIEPEEFSLNEMLNGIRSIMQGEAERKGLDFSVNHIYPLPEKLNSDYVRFKQILINLCGNAIKFTEKGHVVINASLDDSHENLCIDVVDTGIGMDETATKKIFDSFTQADSSTTRKYGGTGLGLNLSRQLARLLGGDITVSSKQCQGSKFKFMIKLDKETQSELIYSEKEIKTASVDNNTIERLKKFSGHVLVAEDNIAIQELLSMLLSKIGLSVSLADNGETACQRAISGDFDLVFMDMQMPHMGGVEAITRLREMEYDKPIVVLTANVTTEDKAACMNAGCSDFLSKPIDINALYEVCNRFLNPIDESDESPVYAVFIEEDPEIEDLAVKFVKEYLPSLMVSLKENWEEQNWKIIQDILHQIKGTAGTFGYPMLTDQAAMLEFQIINQNYNEATLLMNEFNTLLRRIILGHSLEQEKLKSA